MSRCLWHWLPSAQLPNAPMDFAILLSTVLTRVTNDRTLQLLADLPSQIESLRARRPTQPLYVFVALQWFGSRESDGMACLRGVVDRLGERLKDISISGLLLRGPGKRQSINATIPLAAAAGCDGLLLLDDDVMLEPHCLAYLLEAFTTQGRLGAVGARKVGHPKSHRASQWLHRMKNITQPATNYPHSCCMLVAMDVVRGGIPSRYGSDDGYVCFELLDPEAANPLHHLKLVPEAVCHHEVGGTWLETLSRLRRMLLNHHIFMADYDQRTAGFYFSEVLFFGLWPFARFDRSRGLKFGLAKWGIKLIYATWFAAIGAELILRSVAGRPLNRVAWGGDIGARQELAKPRSAS